MGPAKKYILINTLIAFVVLLAYSIGTVAHFKKEQNNEAKRDLERSLASMKELLRAKGEFRAVNGKLLAGDYIINDNFEIPDKIGEIFGGAATIFLKDIRISTNIRNSDGNRATGTRLEGPPYQAVINEGRQFRGEALILGMPYLTAYDPIRDADGKLIGIIFVGIKKSILFKEFGHLVTQLFLLFLTFTFAMAIPAIIIIHLSSKEEETRRAQFRFLQTLMDTIPNPVFYKDIHGKFLGCNKAMENLLNLSRERLIGMTVTDLFGDTDSENHLRMDTEVLETGEIKSYEAQIKLKDEKLHDVIFYKAVYPGPENGAGGIIGTFVDLTEIKNIERALREETEARCHHLAALDEKDKMLRQQNRQAIMGEMIGNISHQWRQPLNTLALISQEMMITFDADGFTREYLVERTAKIADIIRHMSETVDEFTKFFRPEKAAVPFMPSHIISRAIALIDANIKNMQIEIRMNVISDAEVLGFPNEYSQVVLNIVMNARDAFFLRDIPLPRVIAIDITTIENKSVVTITDNAGGISEDNLDRIFESYFTTKEATGTGIGLYLARTIIEKHMNGRLSSQNTRMGASFRIEVPLK